MIKKIYLACPYTHPDPEVMRQRFEAVNHIAAELMRKGDFVFSPISHTHPIALTGKLPVHWGFWGEYDKTFIDWCDELHVLQLPGWEQSVGVNAEIAYAQQTNKPVLSIEV